MRRKKQRDVYKRQGVKSPIGYVLPSAALGVRDAAAIARITRASMLEVTGQDFVKTAYAKGLYSWRIILIHIFQNALVPIITVIGTDIGALLTLSLILISDKIAQVKAQMGLDTPLPVQYFNWLKDLLHGDMGTSYFQKK